MDVKLPLGNSRFTFFNIFLSSSYLKPTSQRLITGIPSSNSSLPFSPSSVSRSSNILSEADIPFIAIWKYEPSILRGRKNSDASRITVSMPARLISPLRKYPIPTNMPTAAPP